MADSMTKFFKTELANLHLKTGLKQFENMKLEQGWKERANALVNEMVLETLKPPFDRVREDVIQRILSDAMMNDKDFIGWNPKWVRIALNAWWGIYGGKVMEALDSASRKEEKPVTYTGPPIDVDSLVKEYLKTLRSGFREVPKLSKRQIQEEGKDRPKATCYPKADISIITEHEARIRAHQERWFRDNYPQATEDQVQEYLRKVNKPKKKKDKI